jgi:hypothetical protein
VSDTDTTSILPLSRHAATRARQRGMRTSLLRIFMQLADRERPAGGACTFVTCSEAALAEARARGLPADDVARLERWVAVVAEHDQIVTVMNRETSYARFQRGSARLGARERATRQERRIRGGAQRT